MNRKIGVILSYLLMVFEVLSTLLLTPYILRTLGQAEYGVYKLSASIIGYLLLLDLGIGNAVIRYASKFRITNKHEEARKFLGVTTIYYLIVAFIALVSGIVLVLVFPTAFAKGLSLGEIVLGQKLLFITMINTAVTLGTAAYNNIIIAYEKFAVSKGVSIIQIIVRMLLTYLALKVGFGSIGIVLVNLVMTVISRTFFVAYVLLKIQLTPQLKGVDRDFIQEIFSYSSIVVIQMVATQINYSVDQIMIGALVATSSNILAVYSVGSQLVQYFKTIGNSFTGVLMPGVVALVERGTTPQRITDEMVRVGRIMMIVLGLVWSGFLVCGPQFIDLWAGNENSQAYIVASLLMTANLIILPELIGHQFLWAMNKHKVQAYLKLSIVVVNIILTIFLIRWNPLIGAAIGTFISLIVGDLCVMNVVFSRYLKINMGTYYLRLFHGIGPCIMITLIVGYIFHTLSLPGWGGLLLNCAAMCIIYGILMITVGMNKYEKNLILSILKKFYIRRGT